MKIVYVLNSGDPGGVEQHVLDLVRGMIRGGHRVFVVCPPGKMATFYADSGAGVKFDRPAVDLDPFYILRLWKFLRETKPDIFHVHQLKTVVNGLIAAKLAGVHVKIVHIHTPLSSWQVPVWKKRLNIFVNRLVTNWAADVVIALTEVTREERIRSEGIAPKKIIVIPNGVDTERIEAQISEPGINYRRQLRVPEDLVLVGTLSRLTVEKGIGLLVDAASMLDTMRLERRDIKYQLLIGGVGALEETLEAKARELGVGDRIRFLGFVPDEEKYTYLAALDIFVFPSLAEGFGIALIEAMACGCACLVSDLPVLREVGGAAVETFRVGEVRDLSRKLSQLVASTEHREALAQAAKERVEKEFTITKFWKRYEALYESCALR